MDSLKPVAWRYAKGRTSHLWHTRHRLARPAKDGWRETPLYTRAALEAAVRLGIEAGAKIIERRMGLRFEEHGTREWDTNACYYQGAAAETFEALDEEADEAIAAILALATPEKIAELLEEKS